MSIKLKENNEGWIISQDELDKSKNCCSCCKKELKIKEIYRCEVTKDLFCLDCNLAWKMCRCKGIGNAEHEHNLIVEVMD